ncbi:dicarboxylate/amino acid:cation symporter [Leptospira sp. 96542]|nr:dicarboxylate/amino acid:cation symporter [Leptospira sp. 96542]
MSFRMPAFWIQVLVGLFLGLFVGVILNPTFNLLPKDILTTTLPWFRFPGDVFLNLLQMIMVPLVIVSIALGVSSLRDLSDLLNLGIRTLLYFVFTTSVAISIGIVLCVWIRPGKYIRLGDSILADVPNFATAVQEPLPNMISNIIPKNIISMWANQQMLSVVLFGLILGIFFLTAKEKGTALKAIIHSIESFCLWVVSFAMKLAPIAVFGLMSFAMIQIGFDLLYGLLSYVLTVLTGLFLLFIFYGLMVYFFTKQNPFRFFYLIREIPLLGFSTSSSSSVLPFSLKVAKENLGIGEKIADFVLPLGATVNMDGTALYQAVATVFLSQVYQVDLSTTDLILLVGTVTAASIGTAATPGVGLVILASILQTFHIPIEGITLLFGVDRFLDMCRTSINLSGDLSCAYIMNLIWKEK